MPKTIIYGKLKPPSELDAWVAVSDEQLFPKLGAETQCPEIEPWAFSGAVRDLLMTSWRSRGSSQTRLLPGCETFHISSVARFRASATPRALF